MKEIELQISQFIDNELNDTEQKELFAVLAIDRNARQTLSDFIQLKKNISAHHNDITTNLLPTSFIPNQTKDRLEPNRKYKAMFYFSLAASIVLAMLLAWNQKSKDEAYEHTNVLQAKYEKLVSQYTNVTETKMEKELASLQLAKNNVLTELRKSPSMKTVSKLPSAEFLNRIKQKYEANPVNRAVITKEDFIGGQIVGN
jgi:hypothetical protein